MTTMPAKMSKSVSTTERFGVVTTLFAREGSVRIQGEHMRGLSPNYTVSTAIETPDGHCCGMTFVNLGSVPGGRGVADRVMTLAREAIADGRHINPRHDTTACGVCSGLAGS